VLLLPYFSVSATNATQQCLPTESTAGNSTVNTEGCSLEELLAAVGASLAGAQPCYHPVALGLRSASCSARGVPVGKYLLGLQLNGALYVLPPSHEGTTGDPHVLVAELSVSGVWPEVGSIGGGTLLTVTGEFSGCHREDQTYTNTVTVQVAKALLWFYI
jgi:hypothetical protein